MKWIQIKREPFIFTSILILFSIFRVWNIQNQQLEIFPDSSRYLPKHGPADYINADVLTNFVYGLTKSSHEIVLLQAIVSTIAWAFIAVVLSSSFERATRIILISLLLGYSLSSPVLTWDYSALTESFSLSFFLIWLASILIIRNFKISRSGVIYWISFLSATFCLLARPRLVTIILPISFLLIYKKFVLGESSKFEKLSFLAAHCGLFALIGYRINELLSNDRMRYWYSLNNFAQKPEYRDWVISRTPYCNSLAHDSIWNLIDNNNLRESLESDCPRVYEFLINQGSGAQWFISEPIRAVRAFLDSLFHLAPLTITSETLSVSKVSDELLLKTNFFPTFLNLLPFLLFTFALISLWKLCYRRKIEFTMILPILIFGNYFQEWISDGMEEHRHVLIPSVVLPILISTAILKSMRTMSHKISVRSEDS